MGLTAGPVPPRVDATVKAGLLTLVAHAQTEGGWSLRRAAAALGLDHVRVLRWLDRAADGPLPDASVDVVTSTCVINLLTDKPAVLDEGYRLLRQGGQLDVSDIVAEDHLCGAFGPALPARLGLVG